MNQEPSFQLIPKEGEASPVSQDIFLNKLKQGELIEVKEPWFQHHFRLEFLKDCLQQVNLEEIIVHHPQEVTLVHSQGESRGKIKLDENLWNWVVSYLCLQKGISFNLNQPFASFVFDLEGKCIRGSFIHHSTLSTPYHKGFFRILHRDHFPLESFLHNTAYEDIDFIKQKVEKKKNILISGSTGSGKTSLLKTLFHQAAQKKSHIITLEDTHELQHSYPWVTSLIAKDHPQYAMENYLTYAMRMRPERMILGEIRSREVVPLLLTLNCGHRGVLATIHANSAPDALYRMATLFQVYNQQTLPHSVVMSLLCHNIDTVIHVEGKKVQEVINILGHDEGRLIYEDENSPNLR